MTEAPVQEPYSIDELIKRYGTADNALLGGTCVAVPERECTLEMEQYFKSKGHRVSHQSYWAKMYVFISLVTSESLRPNVSPPSKQDAPECPDCHAPLVRMGRSAFECPTEDCAVIYVDGAGNVFRDSTKQKEVAPVTEPKPVPSEPKKPVEGYRWTAEGDKIIIDCWKAGKTVEQIAQEVRKKHPDRSLAAVRNRINRLRKNKTIEYRHRKRHGQAKQLLIETPKKTPSECRLYQMDATEVPVPFTFQAQQKRMDEIMGKLEIQLAFSGLQILEAQKKLMIPEKLKELFANVMLNNREEDRLAFQNKLAVLQEAYA